MSAEPGYIDMTKCCLSTWDGDEANCRLCNQLLIGRRTKWCSPACWTRFVRQHKYSVARAACRIRARAKCDCPDVDFYYNSPTKSGEIKRRRRPKHSVCRDCGKCEPQILAAGGTRLECNHIVPVLGQRRTWLCLNHQDNLEMLCHDCHVKVTRAQQHLWSKEAREKFEKREEQAQAPHARRRRKAHVKTTKVSREEVDRPVKRSARRRIA